MPASASEISRNGSGIIASALTIMTPEGEITLIAKSGPSAPRSKRLMSPLRGEPSQLQPIAVRSGVR